MPMKLFTDDNNVNFLQRLLTNYCGFATLQY